MCNDDTFAGVEVTKNERPTSTVAMPRPAPTVGSFFITASSLVPLGMTSIQISKIIAAKSVDGLAPSSIYSDLVIYIVNAVYHIVNGSPFR